MSKGMIFIRERRNSGKGDKSPRFAVVGVAGMDLKLHARHMRKKEIEQMAQILNAEVVYLEHNYTDDEDDTVEMDQA